MLNYSQIKLRFMFLVKPSLTTLFQVACILSTSIYLSLFYLLYIPNCPQNCIYFFLFCCFSHQNLGSPWGQRFLLCCLSDQCVPRNRHSNSSCQKERWGEGRKRIDACCCASLTVPTAGHHSCPGKWAAVYICSRVRQCLRMTAGNASNGSETGPRRTLHNRTHECPF